MIEEEVNRVQVTLLNVQAMTKAKKYEIQNSIENERGILNIVALGYNKMWWCMITNFSFYESIS